MRGGAWFPFFRFLSCQVLWFFSRPSLNKQYRCQEDSSIGFRVVEGYIRECILSLVGGRQNTFIALCSSIWRNSRYAHECERIEYRHFRSLHRGMGISKLLLLPLFLSKEGSIHGCIFSGSLSYRLANRLALNRRSP